MIKQFEYIERGGKYGSQINYPDDTFDNEGNLEVDGSLLWRGATTKGSYVVGEYRGTLTLEDYVDLTPTVFISNITGPGVIQYIPEQTLAIIAKDQAVTVTATNEGPAGTWSTPVQSPTKVGYATTQKVEGEDAMTIEYTFDEDGDWYLTEDLINRDLSGFSFKFTDFHFKVVK